MPPWRKQQRNTPMNIAGIVHINLNMQMLSKQGQSGKGSMMTDCIRLRKNTLCRLDLKPCKEKCPLRKTKEEYENSRSKSI